MKGKENTTGHFNERKCYDCEKTMYGRPSPGAGREGENVNAYIVQKIVTHEFADNGDGTCEHHVFGTTCGYPSAHVIHGYKALPADWFQDSSLATWFPLTAEELEHLKEERDLQAGIIQADAAQIESLNGLTLNLATLVRRLVRKMHQCAPTDPIIPQAMDFLARNDLQGNVLRLEAQESKED